MLELRPNCEWCDRDLPPDSPDARICSYECTYCAACATEVLRDVCATCGGNLTPRPIRPREDYRGLGLGLGHDPASQKRKLSRWSETQMRAQSERLRDTPPDRR
ncbi:urease [Primorskyibacter flagellatus]|uniref:Urease n=1 Tax=Primorskyibacter flagellatus TaxID=1387277 RepID=A0A917A0W7_9RHOB|nr:DUF1272 domain-containing protein [Primorskyibacter flagellatus]GGE21459.1 urease [Primorskyibacter flagellatus]